MKITNFYLAAALLLSSAFLIGSCDDNDDIPPSNSTITDIVVADAELGTLESAVVRANLGTTLSGTGPYTLFAPTDAAFTASGISSSTINALPVPDLTAILLYHTLNGEVMASNVPAGPNEKVTTVSGDSVFVTRNSSGVFINGVAVTNADIDATNGVIHKIGRVLMPPKGNIVETAVASTGLLDSLVKAVTRATTGPGGDPSLANTLSTARLTVFAPTNTAFADLLAALSLQNINQIPMPTLLAVLRYHVVAGRAFSSDLSNGSLTMLAGGSTTINLTNGTGGSPTITGNGNGGNKSNITTTNIAARNGVVHIIDRVLIP